MIGFDNGQLRSLISELMDDVDDGFIDGEKSREKLLSEMEGISSHYPKIPETPMFVHEWDRDSSVSEMSASGNPKVDVHAIGLRRKLKPSILERYPMIDRQKVGVDESLKDFFFSKKEYVYTKADVARIKFEWAD
jgi:hypothetical protein